MSKLMMVGMTDTGMVREHNEDCLVTLPAQGVAILADGMGGHQAGEVASAIAVEQVAHHLTESFMTHSKSRRKTLDGRSYEALVAIEAVHKANGAIHEAARERPERAGMGTTIVVAIFHGNEVTFAHVGDSRAYRFRDGALEQVTEDHSMVQELLKRGLMTPEEVRTSANRNLVTRALGIDPIVEVEITEETFEKGDIYLICSDGLNDVLTDEEIAQLLAENLKNLEDAITAMIAEVNVRGGPDNVSIILVRTDGKFVRGRN